MGKKAIRNYQIIEFFIYKKFAYQDEILDTFY